MNPPQKRLRFKLYHLKLQLRLQDLVVGITPLSLVSRISRA